jgi:gluconolactonase
VGSDGSISGGDVIVEDIGTPGQIEGGIPDGMKCDTEGNVWVTGPQGVWVLGAEGERLGTIEVPEHTGNLTWGGPGWDVLYIPASTSVYRIQTKIGGNRVSYMR